jgi:hypothetical protein
MKRIQIFILLISLIVPSTQAGSLSGYGLRLGFNIANQTDSEHFFLSSLEPEGEKKSRIGFCVGGFITYQVTEWLALQPEILLSVKGAKLEESGSALLDSVPANYEQSWENDETWKLSYIEMPVLAKLQIPLSANLKPNVFIGPALDIMIGSKLDWRWSGSAGFETAIYDSAWDESSKEEIEGLDILEYSLVFGGGFEYELNSGKILFDIRYTVGITKNDTYEVDFKKIEWGHIVRDRLAIRNRTISILIGYSF